MSFDRERYDALKANGLCVTCKQESRPSRTTCQTCADKIVKCPAFAPTDANRKKWSDYRRAVQAQGKCVRCFEPRGKDGTKWRCCWCAADHRKDARRGRGND